MSIALKALILLLLGAVLGGIHLYRWRRDRERAKQIGFGRDCPLTATPHVSVLVPAWNEALNLPHHVRSFQALTYPSKELILCAGGTDGSYEIARRYESAQIHVIEQQADEGKQSALRRALLLANGEIIYLTDADCLLNDSAFNCTIEPLINKEDSASTGHFAPLVSQRLYPLVRMQWYIDQYARSFSPKYVEGMVGRNAAILRETLERIRAFDEPVQIGTDYFLARKLLKENQRIRYVDKSCVETEYKTHVGAYIHQQSRWLRNILLHGAAFGAVDQVQDTQIQCLLGLAVVVFPLTFVVTGWVGIGIWLLIIWHGTLARWRYVRFGEITLQQPHQLDIYYLAPLYLLLDQIMLAYTLFEWLLPSHRWKW